MKALKYHLSNIIAFILFTIVLMIPFLNAFLTLRAMKQTIKKWTNHKCPLWNHHSGDVTITLCNGEENVVVYNGKLIDLECSDEKKHKVIRNTEIKYVRPINENTLEIRLWNERKINKIFGIKNDY